MRCFILACFLCFASCSSKEEGKVKDYILTEKDIIPEGGKMDNGKWSVIFLQINSSIKKGGQWATFTFLSEPVSFLTTSFV